MLSESAFSLFFFISMPHSDNSAEFIVIPAHKLDSIVRDAVSGEISRYFANQQQPAPPLASSDQFLTKSETCSLLRISQPSLFRRMRDGSLPYTKIGGRVLFRRSDLVNL